MSGGERIRGPAGNIPLDPVFAGCFAHPGTGRRNTGTTHDAQCVLYRGTDAAYQGREICLSANETAISIADLTDKRHPQPITTTQYPSIGYAHQGWLTEDHRYFYSTDELDEMRVLDIGDPENPVEAGHFDTMSQGADTSRFVGAWSVYPFFESGSVLVSSRTGGLFVVRPR